MRRDLTSCTVRGGVFELSQQFGVVSGSGFTLKVERAVSAENSIFYTTNGTPAGELFERGAGEGGGLFRYTDAGIEVRESRNPEDFALTPYVLPSDGYSFGYISKGVPLSLIEVDSKGEIVAEERGTFVFHHDGKAHFGSVPVVCLSASVEDLIGADKAGGLYNDVWNVRDGVTVPSDEKIRANIEYYDCSSGECFTLNTQLKVGGNATRGFPVRTLNVNFKKREDGHANRIPFVDIFQGKRACGTGREIKGNVKRFRLHSGGNDAFSSFFNDAFVQRLVSLADTHVATAAYRPCVLYLNGEYWGLYALREHYSEDYVECNYGVDSEDVVYVDKCYDPVPGESKYYFNVKTDDVPLGISLLDELHSFLEVTENPDGSYSFGSGKDWTSDSVYDEFCKMVDIDSLIDIVLIRGYANDVDFIFNNLRMWRTVPNPSGKKTGNSRFSDGKWRFMIHDMDLSVNDLSVWGIFDGADLAVGRNIFDYYTGNIRRVDYWGGFMENTRPELLLSLPARNEKFRKRLWERAKRVAEIFEPTRAVALLDSMESEIEPLYAEKVERWGVPGYSVESWKNAVEVRRQFLKNRPATFLDDVRSAFGITEE